MLDLEFLATDSGGLVPMYFSKLNRSILQTDACNTLAFSPSALAVDAAQPRNSRIPRPVANVSTSEISPKISKDIRGHFAGTTSE
jgi:hypothetical protein